MQQTAEAEVRDDCQRFGGDVEGCRHGALSADLRRQRQGTAGTTRGGGGAIGPHAHGNAARHVVGDLDVEGDNRKPMPATTTTTPGMPTTGPR